MQNKTVSRRTLIKALLASGASIAALSFLPEKWLKPVVDSGVIPAHARASLNSGIQGKVYNGSPSTPLSGVIVTAGAYVFQNEKSNYKLASPAAVGHQTTTDGDGNYSITLAPGSYGVSLLYNSCLTGANGNSPVTVNPGLFTTVDEDLHSACFGG